MPPSDERSFSENPSCHQVVDSTAQKPRAQRNGQTAAIVRNRNGNDDGKKDRCSHPGLISSHGVPSSQNCVGYVRTAGNFTTIWT